MQCKITSPEKTDIFDNITSVILPAAAGVMQVLPQHAEAFIALVAGTVVLEREQEPEKTIGIEGGECYVRDDTVTIVL